MRKFEQDIELPVLPLNDPEYAEKFCRQVTNNECIDGIPPGASLSRVLTHSLLSLFNYDSDAKDGVDDDKVYERFRIRSSVAKAMDYLRNRPIDLSISSNIQKLKDYVLTESPTNLFHPQEFLSEVIAVSLVLTADESNINMDGRMEDVAKLLQMTSRREGFTTNTECYSTRRDEFYFERDVHNTYFELLAMLDGKYIAPSTLLGEHIRDLCQAEMPRKHPYERLDQPGVQQSAFDSIPTCILNGNFEMAADFTEAGLHVGDEKTRAEYFRAFIASIKDNPSEITARTPSIIRMVSTGLINNEMLVIAGKDILDHFAEKESSPIITQGKEHLVTLGDCLRIQAVAVYEAVTAGELQARVEQMNTAPKQGSAVKRVNRHL